MPGEHGPVGGGRWTRRQALLTGVGGLVALAAGGFELIEQGVLPGRRKLDEIDGACSVPAPALSFGALGPSRSGSFHSAARGRTVGYTIAYPPGHGPGSRLPLVVSLHGFGGDHTSGLGALSLARALAARVDGRALPPMALVAADGGGGYWNPHPGDDPQAMLVDELIPRCRALGLGAAPHRTAVIGVSMGGYGALLLAEQHPHLVTAIAAISPAVWTSYSEAHGANAGAFASAADFARDDVITHAAALTGTPVRVASGVDDPFATGVRALAHALPVGAVVEITQGCHDDQFFTSQSRPSLEFIAARLTA